jgi:hypothetical protein
MKLHIKASLKRAVLTITTLEDVLMARQFITERDGQFQEGGAIIAPEIIKQMQDQGLIHLRWQGNDYSNWELTPEGLKAKEALTKKVKYKKGDEIWYFQPTQFLDMPRVPNSFSGIYVACILCTVKSCGMKQMTLERKVGGKMMQYFIKPELYKKWAVPATQFHSEAEVVAYGTKLSADELDRVIEWDESRWRNAQKKYAEDPKGLAFEQKVYDDHRTLLDLVKPFARIVD